jgi:ABC-2 type transport system ATP-binding protein
VVRRVTKVFRDFWLREKVTAVADLDIAVHNREVFGLLGPNGSGKSTTLKMVLGLLFPTRGQIRILGASPTDVQIKSRIGFLPEETYLYPFLSARETLDFYGRLFKLPRGERNRRIDMLLEMVGLSSVAYRRIGEYSKGMQRRIGLAQALINDPDLLILDEPTSGLDPIGTRETKDLIRTLCQRGKTILLSSHLLADVEDVCDRVCILYGGRARAQGTMSELLAQQDMTQILVGKLDPGTLAKIRALLAQAGKEQVEVSTPRQRLEALFMRIVKDAQDQRVSTGGAISGQVAQFLSEGPQAGKALIEELVAAASLSPASADGAQASAGAAANVITPNAAVLDELVADRAVPDAPPPRENRPAREAPDKVRPAPEQAQAPAVQPPPLPKAAKPTKAADRKVIDELLGQDPREDQ